MQRPSPADCLMASGRYLIDVPAVRPITGGSRGTGSAGEARVLQAVHAGDTFKAWVWRAAGLWFMESCRWMETEGQTDRQGQTAQG